jgi:hypothetical protein
LKYSLIIVAVIQILSIPLAIHITKQSNEYDQKRNLAETQIDLALAAVVAK